MDFVSIASVLAGFALLLNHYDCVLLPFSPDETCFLQPAQNLAEGKGMGTPSLDELLPGISLRTYWQPPVYFIALAAWGKLTGFDVLSARWLSRLCAIGVLLLLWITARKLHFPSWLALLCVLWTSLDLTFQYDSNLGRMDMMNSLWLIACLLAFTTYQQNGKTWQAAVAGLFGALATLTHFIAIPAVSALSLVLAWQKRWRDLIWFSIPIAVGWSMWLLYAAQDWQSFWLQLHYQFARKGEVGIGSKMFHLLFPQSILPLFGVFVVNTPPIWFPLMLVSLLAWKRKTLPLSGWLLSFSLVVYCSAAFGGELWYVGWFTPFGYLLLGFWFRQAFKGVRRHLILAGLCLVWSGYQSAKVFQALSSVHELKREIDLFESELVNSLPKGSKVLLHSIPDPFPFLQQFRPDLQLVQLSPTPMPKKALKRILQQSDFFIGLREWGQGQGVPLMVEPAREWTFHTPLGAWKVGVYALKGAASQTGR